MRPTSGLPFLLEEGMEVTFVPPLLTEPKSACVERVTFIKDDAWLVTFEGIGDLNTAEQLVGKCCLVRKADLPDGWDVREGTLVGFTVVDVEHGNLGTVEDVVENPAHPLLSVVSEEGEVLIPAVDEFVRAVDEASGTVTVAVPRSLIELGRRG